MHLSKMHLTSKAPIISVLLYRSISRCIHVCKHSILSSSVQFSALLRHEMVEDMSVFYNIPQRRVSSVIKLGRC